MNDTAPCLICKERKPLRKGGNPNLWICQDCNTSLKHVPNGGRLIYSPAWQVTCFATYINPNTVQAQEEPK